MGVNQSSVHRDIKRILEAERPPPAEKKILPPPPAENILALPPPLISALPTEGTATISATSSSSTSLPKPDAETAAPTTTSIKQ